MENVEFYLRRAVDPQIGVEQRNRMMQMAILTALREMTVVLSDIRAILMAREDT